MPDGVVYKACGNRRAAVCASCAEIYRADAYQLVAAGMKGGKGVPASVGGHPAVFATTTAPGFGLVHTTRTNKKNQPAPCRARKTPGPVPTRCRPALHAPTPDGDNRLGQPLCHRCYDYDHHAVWNGYASELWRRTTIAANRVWAATPATTATPTGGRGSPSANAPSSKSAGWCTSTSWPASTASTPTTATR